MAGRKFERFSPAVCYDKPPYLAVDKAKIDAQRLATTVEKRTLIVPKKTARAWTMEKGDLCRITVCEGSQVCDMNFWNADNPREHFFSGKTRQLHSSHLRVYDQLWSCLPYLRPMATFVKDSLWEYGVDEDGGALHDVIGTRCDKYTYELITGKPSPGSCHEYLTEAVKEFGLTESDVHDVWNIFMCTGFTRDTQQYFCKPSPARQGDHIEFIADMNLIVALSACPHGDVSIAVGHPVPDAKCFPLEVKIYGQR